MTNPVEGIKEAVAEKARETQEQYAHGEDRPLKGYALAMGVFSTVVAGVSLAAWAAGKKLPSSISVGDFALIAGATHKLSRIIAKDSITSPIRAPFTRYEEPAGASELNESVHGDGWKHTVGELIECPFCLAVWTSTAFTAGHVLAPKQTRMVATALSATAVSDFLQFAYSGLKKVG